MQCNACLADDNRGLKTTKNIQILQKSAYEQYTLKDATFSVKDSLYQNTFKIVCPSHGIDRGFFLYIYIYRTLGYRKPKIPIVHSKYF